MFKMNGVKWNIIYCRPGDPKLKRSDNVYTLGVTDYNDKAVYISDALKGQLLYKVLCHELTHVASFSYGYFVPIETEEIIADFISLYGEEIIDLTNNIFYRMKGKRWKQ